MSSLKNPILFSKHFGIDPSALSDAGLIDPFLHVDTQLFIDPILLAKSANETICTEAQDAFKSHFENFVRLLVISNAEGDVAWRGAQRLLDLREPPENGLGYGGSGRSGSSRPDEIRDAIMRTAKEIIELGSRDPEMISLMGFFEERVGPDTISDFTTRVIVRQLAKITEDFCLRRVSRRKSMTHIRILDFLISTTRMVRRKSPSSSLATLCAIYLSLMIGRTLMRQHRQIGRYATA